MHVAGIRVFKQSHTTLLSGESPSHPIEPPCCYFPPPYSQPCLQIVELKQNLSPWKDAEGYLLVAAASVKSEGGSGRQLSNRGHEVTANCCLSFISIQCHRKGSWGGGKVEGI